MGGAARWAIDWPVPNNFCEVIIGIFPLDSAISEHFFSVDLNILLLKPASLIHIVYLFLPFGKILPSIEHFAT